MAAKSCGVASDISTLRAVRVDPVVGFGSEQPLAGFEQAHPPRGATSLQPFIGLLLLLRRDHRLANVAAFPDPGSRDELGAAPAALFRHRLLQRENARLLGQQMRIMEIAMIHFRHLALFGDQTVPEPGHSNWVLSRMGGSRCLKTQQEWVKPTPRTR